MAYTSQHSPSPSPTPRPVDQRIKRKPPPSVHSEDLRPPRMKLPDQRSSRTSSSTKVGSNSLPSARKPQSSSDGSTAYHAAGSSRTPSPLSKSSADTDRPLPPLPAASIRAQDNRPKHPALRVSMAETHMSGKKAAEATTLSVVLCEPSTTLALNTTYPSIGTIASSIRNLSSDPKTDLGSYQNVAILFNNSVRTILRTMKDLPPDVHIDEEFEMGRQSSEFFAQLYAGFVKGCNPSASPEEKQDFLESALEYMDSAMGHLDRFIQRANALLSETAKPKASTHPLFRPKVSATPADVKAARRRTVADYIKDKPQKDSTDPNSDTMLLELLNCAMTVRANPMMASKAKNGELPECGDPDAMSLVLKERLLKRVLIKSHNARVLQGVRKQPSAATRSGRKEEDKAKADADPARAQRGHSDSILESSPPAVATTPEVPKIRGDTEDAGVSRASLPQLFLQRQSKVAASLRKFGRRGSAASPDRTTGPLPPMPRASSSLHRLSIRQSMFVHPDPRNPDETVTMPKPTGEAWEILVDAESISRKASLPALIRLITSIVTIRDPELNHIFFKFFRLFTTPSEVFNMLGDRFRELPPGELSLPQLEVWNQEASCTRMRVIMALLKWIKEYWRPETDTVILVPLLDFLYTHVKDGSFATIHAWSIIDALCKCESQGANYQPYSVRHKIEYTGRMNCTRPWAPSQFLSPPRGASSATMRRSLKGVGGPVEMARHLTLLASELFLKIDPEEAVMKWRDEKGNDKSTADTSSDVPNQVASHTSALHRFEENVTLWIQHTVLEYGNAEERANEISFWLSVAEACLDLRNFCVAFAINSAIVSAAVFRLKITAAAVSADRRTVYSRLKELFGASYDYRNYRSALDSSSEPAVPVISLLARDIIATTAVARDTEALVNLHQYRIMWKTIRLMACCQIPYGIKPIDALKEFVQGELVKPCHTSDQKVLTALYERSLALEPRSLENANVASAWDECLKSQTAKSPVDRTRLVPRL